MGVAGCGVAPCATTVNGSCCVEVEVLSSCVLRFAAASSSKGLKMYTPDMIPVKSTRSVKHCQE